MRFELAGSITAPDPLILKFNANSTFDPAKYTDLGYTDFDVICIGGGGGMGGGINTANTGTQIRSYGGAGGGGGLQRVQGLLSALPPTCPVVVGAGGSLGTDHDSNVGLTTDGGDGGYSSFNGATCQASGGKGGKRVQSNSLTVATMADGGEGGMGGRTLAGGGASGGTAGTPTATGPGVPGTDGSDGTWSGNIGKGGGGGAGGVGKYGSGGTKAAPLNGQPTVYGSSQGARVVSDPGVVILRLTLARR
jgi:Glycine-rich domain